MTTNDTEVLIAGAGPTGLTLAVELARRGVSCRLIDKADTHFAGSRGDGLQPRTLEVFDDLGVLDRITAIGRTAALHRAYQGDQVVWAGRTAEPVEPTPAVPYPNALFVPQWLTEQILRDRLAELGGTVELGTELLDFTAGPTGVTATVTQAGQRAELRAGYLVGADGGRSVVRRTLGVPFRGDTDESVRMLLADVRVAGLDHELGHMFSAPEAPTDGVAFTPLYGTFPDAFVLAGPAPADDDLKLTLEYFQDLVDRLSGRTDVRLRELLWATVWRLNVRLADRFRVGRVFLAGDAAHVHSPTGGQGLNTGVQDGYNLGWKLAAVLAGAPDSLLDSYQDERLPVAEAVLELSNSILAKHLDGAEDALARGPETQQLGLNYRGGPLSRDLRSEPGPVQAGDRAPDAPVQDAAGRPVRLFDLLRGPQWTVLGFGAEVAALRSDRVRTYLVGADIVDPQGHLRAGYQVADGTVVLIRPDGYLGMVAPATELRQVTAYLRAVLG